MKKFTKGCLMTALVLFLVGLILSIVCGLLGGFRQLSEMNGISWIPIRYARNAKGGAEVEFLGHEWEDLGDLDDISEGKVVLEEKLKELDGKKEQLSLTADTLEGIDIDVEACNVLIQRSEDEHVWLLMEGDSNKPRYRIENEHGKSVLRIENEVKHHHLGSWDPNDTLYLWLPEGCALEECEISIGAGWMESIFIKAKKTEISVGAGALAVDGFEGDEILLSAGAGEILAGRVTAGRATFEVGAGHLGIEELSVNREVNLSVSAGNCEIAGTITGDLDLECDMGVAELHLTGSEDDHSYDVECGMGEAVVGSFRHSGFATEKSWNTGRDSEFDIDCNMGTVTVIFEE